MMPDRNSLDSDWPLAAVIFIAVVFGAIRLWLYWKERKPK